jgi:hypothetical protein
MSDYQAKVYRKQGGDEQVIAAGGKMTVESGGQVDQQAGSISKIGGAAIPENFTFAPAAGAANVCEVTIQPRDGAGNALAGIRNLELWLSDAATGAGLTGTTASGAVAVKSNEGTDLTDLAAKKHKLVQTKAAGTYVLSITDSAKTGFYVCVRHPVTGVPIVSAQLQTADYGA